MKLKDEFCYRIILDESTSFGIMGDTGRGATEHFGIKITEVEVMTISLDTALNSVGGVCVGTHEVVDHQRLSGAGYCFSAAVPPFLASSAICSLRRLDENGKSLMSELNKNSLRMKNALRKIKNFHIASDYLNKQVEGNDNNEGSWNSPIMFLSLVPSPNRSWEEDEELIHHLCEMCIERGVGVTTLKINTKWLSTLNKELIRPSLRICVSTLMNAKQINYAAGVIKDCAKSIKPRQ